MARFLLAVGALFLTAALAPAQDEEPGALYPVPLPSPALKYRLLPDLRNQTAGDALPVYFEAIEKLAPVIKERYAMRPDNPFQRWATTPLKELPRDEVRKALEPYQPTLDLVDKAARRERCRGEAPAEPAKNKVVRFPEQFYLDEMATLLAVQARLHLADGNLDAAAHTLQTGLSFARQVGELPRLEYVEIGTTIAVAMLRQIEDFVQQPKAPNLYWALTDLPRPLIDAHQGVQGSRLERYRLFPGLEEVARNLDAGPLPEEQVQAWGLSLLRYLPRRNLFDLQQRAALTRRLTDRHEDNKKNLIAAGRPKEKVEAMPHVQVALLADHHAYAVMRDEQIKWYGEPFDKIADRLDALESKEAKSVADNSLVPIDVFGIFKVYWARAALERRINLLRCVEAVRAYAAAHDGKLPASLNDVKDVPIPLDPVTGKPFEYKVAGGKATFETPEVPRASRRNFDDLTYEFVIKRP